MTAQTRTQLYQYFQTGDKPTQGEFQNLIDSSLNIADASAQSIVSDVSCTGTLDVNNTFTVAGSAQSNLTGNLSVSGSLTVSGATTFAGGITFSSDVSVGGSLTVAGSAQLGPIYSNGLTIESSGFSSLSGNVSVSGILNPAGGIAGVTNGGNPTAGNVGEYISAFVSADAAITLSNAVTSDITYVALTAGDWDVGGNIISLNSGTATIWQAAVNVSSATLPAAPGRGSYNILVQSSVANSTQGLPTGIRRINVSASTNAYLLASSVFIGSMVAYGFIGARRIR